MDEEHEEKPPPPPVKKGPTIYLKKPTVVTFPKRAPSVVIPERVPVYITPDKTTCTECPCFPKESPYVKPAKLRPCLQSPLTLYEYAAAVIDNMPLPEAFKWSEERVAQWMEEVVGLPEYKETMIRNKINGRRLLMLEDMNLPEINIHNFEHMKRIVTQIHKLYATEIVKFSRSIGLPPRKPLTHCTWFKARTGPTWAIRQNWSRSDVLRWMKILDPAPVRRDHWELVWYQKPDFPKTMFAKIPPAAPREKIPRYVPPVETCIEYQVPRKFHVTPGVPAEGQFIWDEPRVIKKSKKVQTVSISKTEVMKKEPLTPKTPETITIRVLSPKKKSKEKPKESRLIPKKICLEGLAGDKLILARRLMPKQKFIRA